MTLTAGRAVRASLRGRSRFGFAFSQYRRELPGRRGYQRHATFAIGDQVEVGAYGKVMRLTPGYRYDDQRRAPSGYTVMSIYLAR